MTALPRSLVALAVAAGSLLTLAACGESEGGIGSAGFSVTDSAGVEIVRNELGRPDRVVPELTFAEDLRVGALDGPPELLLHAVRDIAVAPDGAIVVALLGTNEIRIFDSAGEHQATLGGEGQGPGEFQGLTRVYVPGSGDTLVALDSRLRRVTTLTRDGEVVETVTLPVPENLTGLFAPAGRAGDAWVVSGQVPYEWPEHGRHVELESRLFVVPDAPDVGEALARGEAAAARRAAPAGDRAGGPSGAAEAELAYRRGRMYGMRMGPALTGQRPLWEPVQQWAADGRGRILLTAAGAYQIDVFDATGGLLRRVHGPHRPVPITPEHVNRFMAEARAHHDTTEAPTEFGTDPMERERFRTELPMPEHFPPTGRILASEDGSFMVERPDLVDDPVALEWTRLGSQETRWDLFDPDGRLRGRLRFRPAFTPHVFGEDWIVGVDRDDLGVQYVVRYRLEGTSAGRGRSDRMQG